MKESKAVPKNRRTQVGVRLSEELLAQVDRLAKKEQRNRSNMIEWLLREAVADLGKKRATA